MSKLWIPSTASAAQKARTEQFTAQLMAEADVVGRVRHWNKELKRIDPYLEVVKAKDEVTHPALKPGYYVLIRRPPVGPPAVVLHEGPNGEWRELDSSILQTARDSDMWSAERQRDRAKMARQAEKVKQRAEEREHEERVDEIMDRLKARNAPGVRIPRSLG